MPQTPLISVELLCMGKLKGAHHSYLQEGFAQYAERLKPYCKLIVTELPDEKIKASHTTQDVQALEGSRILKYLDAHPAYVVVLTEHAKALDSPQFAEAFYQRHPGLNSLSRGKHSGERPHLIFVVGGATGLSSAVLARADWALSLSPMTFPHLMVRLLWVEQLYRAFRILNHEPYHK
ncbi:MAG: 23S rRNA (pseudouridine(1915)-N(3))-methyltransferase RlmH [Vampirovibrionales bacterium]